MFSSPSRCTTRSPHSSPSSSPFSTVMHLVSTGTFWDAVEGWQQLLMPAYQMLRDVETHEPRLHLVYESALQIQEHYNSSKHIAAQRCGSIWAKDWEYLHTPIHSCAHMLYPRYQTDNLKDNDDLWSDFLDVCERVLGAEDGALAVQQFNLYHEQQGIIGNKMAQGAANSMAPHEWWASYGASAPQLKALAMKVLSQPASASASEQSWSEHDFVHSKRRNRLKVNVARDLVYVHSNLRLLRKSRNCSRYVDLLKLSAEQARLQQSKMLDHVSTEGWDGDCSDEEETSGCADTITSNITSNTNTTADTAEPNTAPLDAGSSVHRTRGSTR